MDWKQYCFYMQEISVFNRLLLHQRSLLELSTNEIDCLSRIALSKELLSASEVIEQMSSNKVSLSRIIKRLLKYGYLLKVNNPNDSRSYYLKITPKGKKVLKKDYEKLILPIKILSDSMEDKQFLEFMNQISHMNQILKDYYHDREECE